MALVENPLTAEEAQAEKDRRRRVNAFAGDLGETISELRRLQDEVARKATEIRLLDGKLSVMRHDMRAYRRDLKAAIKAKGAPLFIDSDERWLFQRNAVLKFKSKPGGTDVLMLRCHGRNRLMATGEGSLRKLIEQARERERDRARPKPKRD